MLELVAGTWTGAAVAGLGLLVGVALFLRYRSLVRRGSGLPPGTGGARLVGLEVEVVRAHVPGRVPGAVVALGDRWAVADDVAAALAVGDRVRVVEVVGTRLVVAPVLGGGQAATGHPDRAEPGVPSDGGARPPDTGPGPAPDPRRN